MNTFVKTLKVLGYISFFGVMVWLAVILFFEAEYNGVMNRLAGLKGDDAGQHEGAKLVIAEPVAMRGFEPTVFDSFTRQRLNNVYETLIKPDRDLNMKPALALSWGLIDENTWKFVLREGVEFHDGTTLDSRDVVASLDRAMNYEGSELADMLSTLDEVEILDKKTIVISTKEPDPLLLSKMATVYILPREVLENPELTPVGTGSYLVQELTSNGVLKLSRFAEYWGDAPDFAKVDIVTIENTDGRVRAIQDGSVDVLDYVPHDFVDQLGEDMNVYSIPSLEVQFLVFNTNRSLFNSEDMRKAALMALDREEFANYLGKFVRPSYQFVSNGVFGYNPDVEQIGYDEEGALEIAKKRNVEGRKVSVILPKGLETLGEYLEKRFGAIGLVVEVEYPEDYLDALENGKYDIYFMGFKSELGDASDFFVSSVHTDFEVEGKHYGQYNFAKYSRSFLDLSIGAQGREMEAKARLFLLQELMTSITENDPYGIPLFEYETVFAAKDGLKFEPRIDGFIYLNEITYED